VWVWWDFAVIFGIVCIYVFREDFLNIVKISAVSECGRGFGGFGQLSTC